MIEKMIEKIKCPRCGSFNNYATVDDSLRCRKCNHKWKLDKEKIIKK